MNSKYNLSDLWDEVSAKDNSVQEAHDSRQRFHTFLLVLLVIKYLIAGKFRRVEAISSFIHGFDKLSKPVVEGKSANEIFGSRYWELVKTLDIIKKVHEDSNSLTVRFGLTDFQSKALEYLICFKKSDIEDYAKIMFKLKKLYIYNRAYKSKDEKVCRIDLKTVSLENVDLIMIELFEQ